MAGGGGFNCEGQLLLFGPALLGAQVSCGVKRRWVGGFVEGGCFVTLVGSMHNFAPRVKRGYFLTSGTAVVKSMGVKGSYDV